MNRWLALVVGVLVVSPLALLSGSAAASAAQTASDITVVLDKDTLDAGPGEKIAFRSTVRNVGDRAQTDLVAHLNILTTDPGVYVDPEDWSPTRTQYVDRLDPGDAKDLTWNVQAVTSGPLILYVSVTSPSSDGVSSSGPLNLTVGGQRVVDSGAVLALVLWMPSGVLALVGATLVRRRRHR